MTPETAKHIREGLYMPWSFVRLRVDGHDITASVQRAGKNKLRYWVAVYVDGYIRGENLKPESEIGAKFYPLRTRCLISRKEMDSFRKQCGKREADKFTKRAQYQYREAFFSSGAALLAHLRKHCTSVEIASSQETTQ